MTYFRNHSLYVQPMETLETIFSPYASLFVHPVSFGDPFINSPPNRNENGAQTWWQYRNNGEASWIGKTAGGDKIQLDWDGLGLLKAVSDIAGNTVNAQHDFTYAPSGLRIRDKRTGTARATPHDKRYAYTTGGALLTAYDLSPTNTNTITGRRDIVYANGEAIAEIDQNNNIYE